MNASPVDENSISLRGGLKRQLLQNDELTVGKRAGSGNTPGGVQRVSPTSGRVEASNPDAIKYIATHAYWTRANSQNDL
jgi:hypothetical protein